MIRNLRKLFTVITVSVLAQTSLFGQTESSIKNVFWQPNDLQPGSVTFVTVELNRKATKVSGQFLGKDLLFFYSGRAGVDAHEFLRANGHDLEYDSPSFRLMPASDVAPAIRC